ncbi:hypothetical protein WMF30_15610 [Sorangium sp. So ce134]
MSSIRTMDGVRKVLASFLVASGVAAAAACAGEPGAPGEGEELALETAEAALDGAVDFADYMLPNCDGPSVPQYIYPQAFRTLPLGVSSGRARFAVVKSVDGKGFEDWYIDNDWLYIRADNTWAFQQGEGWCDTECGMHNQTGAACHSRHIREHAGVDFANTIYYTPGNFNAPAPFIKRRLNFVGGAATFSASMGITGQHANGCGQCATNFDSPNVTRRVTARRYASRTYNNPCGTPARTFNDVIELTVDSGPGEGERSVYARGQGFIGFGGRNEPVLASCWPDASVPTPTHPDCNGGSASSICAAIGRSGGGGGGCPCIPGTSEENACYYTSPADRARCGLPSDRGCSGDEWLRGWNAYHAACGL